MNPNIMIYRNNANTGNEYNTDELFSTACHETAHTTHWQVMNAGIIQYGQVSESIRESWAVGVEWFITQKEYKEHGISNYATATYDVSASYPIRFGYQYWPINSPKEYSCVFIDLVDSFNQNRIYFNSYGTSTLNDTITGYTLAVIESAFLKHVYGLSSLREKLKANKPAGITDAQIDTFMDNF